MKLVVTSRKLTKTPFRPPQNPRGDTETRLGTPALQGKAHFPTVPSLHLRHNSLSNPSVALPTSQLIPNPSVASPTSQFTLQPFFRFSYVRGSSLNITSGAAHGICEPLHPQPAWGFMVFSVFIITVIKIIL